MGTEILRPHDCLNQRLDRVPPAISYHRRCSHASSNTRFHYWKPANRPIVDRAKRNGSSKSLAGVSISKRSSSKNLSDDSILKRCGYKSLSEGSILKRSASDEMESTKNGDALAMGRVTILRRGESLDSKIKSVRKGRGGDYEVVRVGAAEVRSGMEMEEMIGIDDLKLSPSSIRDVRPVTYAGSAFSLSPSPSSLPVPSFSKKKEISPIIVDSATRDLRRLLRLD